MLQKNFGSFIFELCYKEEEQCKNALTDPETLTFDLSTVKTTSLVAHPKVDHYTKFEHFGIISSFVLESWGEGWPSGKMSDCNARGRGFKSRSGQNKFTKK